MACICIHGRAAKQITLYSWYMPNLEAHAWVLYSKATRAKTGLPWAGGDEYLEHAVWPQLYINQKHADKHAERTRWQSAPQDWCVLERAR